MTIHDIPITCKICGDTFVFSEGEQTFYHDRQLAEPQRCQACRKSRGRDIQQIVRDEDLTETPELLFEFAIRLLDKFAFQVGEENHPYSWSDYITEDDIKRWIQEE